MKIILYIENLRGTLGLTCDGCNSIIKIPLEDVSREPIKCECGLRFTLSEEDIQYARKSMEDIGQVRREYENLYIREPN
jgi:hypothetical protein